MPNWTLLLLFIHNENLPIAFLYISFCIDIVSVMLLDLCAVFLFTICINRVAHMRVVTTIMNLLIIIQRYICFYLVDFIVVLKKFIP